MRRICLLFILIVPIQAEARDWTAALDRGEVLIHSRAVKGFEEPEVVMKAVINVAPRRVFDLLADCAGYVRSMPRIKSARVDRRGKMSDVCTVTVDMPFPYSDVTSTCRSTYTIKKDLLVRSWRLVRGDYKLNRGRWELRPFKGDPKRTLVIYRAIAVPKAWVPGWIRTYAAKRSLPETIERFREVLGSG
jgi:ribosome-associated toxin RatA of RatAB toxin-antitoxin module